MKKSKEKHHYLPIMIKSNKRRLQLLYRELKTNGLIENLSLLKLTLSYYKGQLR